MNKFAAVIIKNKMIVITVFLALALLGALVSSFVSVNYDMVDYLPNGAQSTTAIDIMKAEFGGELPNARVMISNVTINQALGYKKKLASIDGVSDVTWIDDIVGLSALKTTPVEFLDQSVIENYYLDDSALFSITIESGKEKTTVSAIRDLIGDGNALSGEAVDTAASQEMSVSEVIKAMAILLPVIIIILILATTSWIEPLLFLAAIGTAVLINMGTNIFLGEISFMTSAISPILQLAVSLDYAIFLLHSFDEYRLQYEPKEAMRKAMKKALSAVAASAATTVFGFMALMFMRFRIGSDLGINLVKGVVLSFISVMVFLPALTLAANRYIDKSKHRRIIPDFKGAGKLLTKISAPFMIVVLIIAIPCFLAQSNVGFLYGTGDITQASRSGKDAAIIEKQFGKENALVLLVPNGDTGTETELCDDLSDIAHVKSIISYVSSVGAEIPPDYISQDVIDQFYSEKYARIILYTDMESESTDTFDTVQTVLDTAAKHYGEYYLAGQSATLYDMKNIVSTDTKTVNLCAVIGIFFVLLFTFRSLSLPLFLLFTIETAIWVNLSFVYFTGQALSFIGYLVISTVQLGSTVDYAILLTDRYLANRKESSKKEAIQKALGDNLIALLISAAILATAGFTLALTSSNPIISELGLLLGRGTLLSLLMVVCVLPSLLVSFDSFISKTTYGFNHKHHTG